MTKKNPISVPDGYFASLEERLQQIPAQKAAPRFRMAPYLAFAASLLALAVIGNFILRKSSLPELSDDDIRSYLLASNTSVEQIYSVIYEEDY